MVNNFIILPILLTFLLWLLCEGKFVSNSDSPNDIQGGQEGGGDKTNAEKSTSTGGKTEDGENNSYEALAMVVKEIFRMVEDIKNFTEEQEKTQATGRSLNLFNPFNMVQNIFGPPPSPQQQQQEQLQGPQLIWLPPTFSTEYVGSPYLPGNPHNVITIVGMGTQERPCQKHSKFVGPPPINSLGGDAAKGWKKGTDVASLNVGGALADWLAGGKGKITQDQAITDPIYIAIQDIFAAVGGPVIDTAAKLTGLGEPLQQLGIGSAFGAISGLILGTLGTGALLKTPMDGVKVIASLTGLQGLIGMKGKSDWGEPTNIPVPSPSNPCGSGQFKIPLKPPRLSAGR